MKIKLTTQGNPSDVLVRPDTEVTTISKVVGNLDGKSVFVIRNGATLDNEIGEDFRLEDGDEVMLIANKRVGING